MNIAIYIGLALAAYLLGSLPTAFIFTQKLTGQDIRKHGSGNVGSTNAVRVLGRKMGGLVFLIDTAKGFIITFIAYLTMGETLAAICGALAVIGHIFPIWLKFKGGKGVATALGAGLALFPIWSLIALGVWALVLILSGIVAVASCAAAAALAGMVIAGPQPVVYGLVFLMIALLVIFKHKANFAAMKK